MFVKENEKEEVVTLRALKLAVPIWLDLGWGEHVEIANKMIAELEEAGV